MSSYQIILNCSCVDSYVKTHTHAPKKNFKILLFFQYAQHGVSRNDNDPGFFQNLHFSRIILLVLYRTIKTHLSYVYISFDTQTNDPGFWKDFHFSRIFFSFLHTIWDPQAILFFPRFLFLNCITRRQNGVILFRTFYVIK
jgi:hypothetical protein